MTKDIWVSTVMNSEAAQSGFVFYRYDDAQQDPEQEQKAAALEQTLLSVLMAKPFGDDDYPKRMVWDPVNKATRFDGLPPVSIRRLLVLRADVADIFARHKLGDARLVPVDLYDSDNTTKFDDQAYLLVPRGARKTVETTEAVQGLRKIRYTNPPRFHLGGVTEDLSGLSDITLDMPDDTPACWMDPQIANAVFLNTALVNDLQAAGHAKHFYLTQL